MVYSDEKYQNKTILVVDDDFHILKLIAKFLTGCGYKILTAQTGYGAIKSAFFDHPDLIILDVLMSDIDGFSICSHLKSSSITQNIPIIFMTALTGTKSKIRGFAAGAVDYVTKPIVLEELSARIATHLRLQNLYQRSLQDINRQKLLLETSDRIRQCLDLKLIMETAVKEIRTFLNCESVWLTRITGDDIILETFDSTINSLSQRSTWNYICSSETERLFYQQGNIKAVDLNDPGQAIEASAWLNRSVEIILPVLIGSNHQLNNSTKDLESPEQALLTASLNEIDSDILWGWLILDYQCCSQWQIDEIELLQVLTNQLAIGIKQGLLLQQLSQQACIDPLTQVYNRRHFDSQLRLEWHRLQRTVSSLSLIVCDVDCFKLYNDTYGHQQGDQCLQQIAQAISGAIRRPADSLARFGGEEFVVILPQTHRDGAIQVAENIRQAVRKLNLIHPNSTVDSVVTVSLGVAHTIPNINNHPQLLLEAADQALYNAKDNGRNCVAVHPSPISIVRKPSSFRRSVDSLPSIQNKEKSLES